MGPDVPNLPLAVDLDGSLLRSDLLFESALKLLRLCPRDALAMPIWLRRGRAYLKQQIASRVDLDVATLPFDQDVVAWIRAQRDAGRRIVLCTAADQTLARQATDHLGLFDEVIASDGVENNSSHRKAAALVMRFGMKGFDYVGNSHADVPVWAAARRAIVVGGGAGVARAARRVADVEREFRSSSRGLAEWLKALRMHQWVKNLLVFLPLLGAHRLTEWNLFGQAFVAFLSFGLCASSVYVLNDLVDVESDRRHSRKRHRPFASGALSPFDGLAVSMLCLLAAFVVGSFVGIEYLGWLAFYWATTVCYTFLLKRKMLVDALTLAALYTLRILAGGAAVGIAPGFWLLALSFFLFLSLAFVKRYAELESVVGRGLDDAHGRGYVAKDLPLIETLGIASGFSAVVVLAFYINGQTIAARYLHQQMVWLTVPILLYWVSRMWVKAHRGEMVDDPVVFAVSDGLSQLTIGAFALVLWIASQRW